ncbi:MAG TPA: DUF1338 domain-containing protein [Phycisphaerae bacterium]|nr:DUF1338 domain-containing protein [Phycisphaerae bacterium]HOJ72647.1 DUF1338 domain-containing protein [Phycisphaerae bacterium]HOM49692.1 DUF1338 domain-containing protein [Phycisphaerae bacterium]HON65171.1 DUF1338 domain-containing protein [Phycisphaerae bacterium]HOQ85128.1 DUF1338 domain-containing protein [Phycisphaerae bacterium]
MSAERVLKTLLERLWNIYRSRVTYARKYAELVEARGGLVVNDHIAFRTFKAPTGSQPAGIAGIERVFLSLGYRPAGEYAFPDTHLSARHYQHPDPLAPKIFISQLEVDELPEQVANKIREAISDARDHLDAKGLRQVNEDLTDAQVDALADQLVTFFTMLPWPLPKASLIREINAASQYAAWTLLHGNNVNHFTAYINEQSVPEWPDIEATVDALIRAGVPMKREIEGARGSKLRQTATQAVDVDCPVLADDGRPTTLRWAYAYYELAERGEITDESGRRVRFQGFLGPQAAQLFEMTRR